MLNKKALAASVSAPPAEYVEDVFSTYLYTGNGSTQTITNGIDLAGKGGLVWTKTRTYADTRHAIFDTERSTAGNGKYLSSDNTDAQATAFDTEFDGFNSDGYSLDGSVFYGALNLSAEKYVSWTFREQPKFFDIVTYTGTGSARTIAHNLGSVPGMIIVKRTDSTDAWQVYHRANTANPETDYLVLNTDAATADSDTRWNDTLPTSTVFSLGTDATVNANTGTYVAYLFAHDAGGFGTAGTDNIITCGSYSGTGSAQTIELGFEPQWILIKQSSGSNAWNIWDNMRGMFVGGNDPYLQPNSSGAEDAAGSYDFLAPTATGIRIDPGSNGYSYVNTSGQTYIYMAIRRPMKVPTTGTEVFAADIGSSSGNITFDAGFPVDLIMYKDRTVSGELPVWDRLRGGRYSSTNDTDAESANDTNAKFDSQTSWYYTSAVNFSNYIGWLFKRAPGFFDIVCYTGTGSARTVTHNLGVAPELMIVKRRNGSNDWAVYAGVNTDMLELNTTAATNTNSGFWNNTTPTSSVFSLGTNARVNANGGTYVAYLFATVAGVSKVGSYTGNGSNQTIDCGFSAGARFVLIKRTDSTGDWCVFDTTRGIVSGNDPFLQLNSDAAEVTNEDAVDPANSGFIVNETTENLNVNNATYIFLAIA